MHTPDPADDSLAEKLRELEARLSRIEERLDIIPPPSDQSPAASGEPAPAAPAVRDEDELEFEVGQNWFAKVGIVVIALGIVFLLTFPYTGLPAAAPGLFGYALAGGLFLIAHVWRDAFDIVSRYLRGSGMLLLFFTTLRLFFWGTEPALSMTSATGPPLVLGVLAVNLVIALRRKSPYLVSLALATGFASAIAVATPVFLLLLTGLLCGLAVYARLKYEWPGVLLFSTMVSLFVYGVWMVNNPFHGNAILVQATVPGLYALLGYAVILASGTLLRADSERENAWTVTCSFLAGTGSFGLFLLHIQLSAEPAGGVPATIASLVFLGIAIAFWVRERSRLSTFIYAILGYTALSVSIIQSFAVPGVFVWLSVQSILVVGTAVWFRSRFIVVTNFIIYLMVVVGYIVVSQLRSRCSGKRTHSQLAAGPAGAEDGGDEERVPWFRVSRLSVRALPSRPTPVCKPVVGGDRALLLPAECHHQGAEVPVDGALHPVADRALCRDHRDCATGADVSHHFVSRTRNRPVDRLADIHTRPVKAAPRQRNVMPDAVAPYPPPPYRMQYPHRRSLHIPGRFQP
jgi:hypothetical protein